MAQSPTDVQVTTQVRDGQNGTGTGSPPAFDLGSIIHDFVTVLTGGSDIPGGSSVSFQFYVSSNCVPLAASGPVDPLDFGPNPLSPPVSGDSGPRGPLHAGDYAWEAAFTSGLSNPVSNGVSPCEPFTVTRADTTTTTEVQDSTNQPVTVIDVFGGEVHDSATVTGDPQPFPVTGTVTYSFWNNFTCSGTPATTETVPVGTDSTPQTLGAGMFSYQAHYNGSSDYNESTSACEPFTVMPTIKSGSCGFDKDADLAGQQFRLIFTPVPTTTQYRLSASNPGEFYYNALITGTAGQDFTLTITFPYPWVTKGTVPTHFFDGVSFHQADGKWCASPSGNELGSSTSQVMLSDYTNHTSTRNLVVNGTFDGTGMAYVRVHIDFGLKATLPWTKVGTTATAAAPNPAVPMTITSPDTWDFSDSAGGGAALQSENVFKQDPAIAGLVLDQYGNPVAGTQVKIYDSKMTLKATVTTDLDGWYQWNMKFSGKTVTWTVKVPAYGLSSTVTGPSKTFYVVSFTATV